MSRPRFELTVVAVALLIFIMGALAGCDGKRGIDCNALIGGGHPDIPSKVVEECRRAHRH